MTQIASPADDHSLSRSLKPRHVTMITIGGIIGALLTPGDFRAGTPYLQTIEQPVVPGAVLRPFAHEAVQAAPIVLSHRFVPII